MGEIGNAVAARLVLLLAAAAIVVGSYGPWLNDPSGDDSLALYGVDGYGVYVAIGGALIVLFGLLRIYLVGVVIAALVSTVGLITFMNAKDRTESVGADYYGGSIGWGLLAVVAGGCAAVASAGICVRAARPIAEIAAVE